MVAIFTGLGTGFERGSGSILGAMGLLGGASMGRGNERVYLNAATGNLMINNRDEFLVGRGPDVSISRTYNSLGDFSDDNGDNWRQSTDRRIYGLTGTLNAAGSTVKRVSADGSEITYSWDSAKLTYVATGGVGAYDTLFFNNLSNTWIWTDGDSRLTETYASFGTTNGTQSWRLSQLSDLDGNKLTYSYTGANLTRVATANGDYVEYGWSGNNITQIVTYASGATPTLTRTRYSYDTSNRLSTVTVDLSPNDSNVADNRTYLTTYTYDGTSKRVASISQSDGSKVEFTHSLIGSTYRVTAVRQWVDTVTSRVLTIGYDVANSITTLTDPSGAQTLLSYDANGQLVQVQQAAPTLGAGQPIARFDYNGSGDVVRIRRFNDVAQLNAGNAASEQSYTYDANGNAITTTDSQGIVTRRVYGARNELLSEKQTLTGNLTATTRYVYDAENHLRYVISPENRVTEYRYTSSGMLEQTIEYPEHVFANPPTTVLQSYSFETPEVGTGSVARPVVSGMTFTGNSGITGNTSAFGFAPSPDGDQVAYLKLVSGTSQGFLQMSISGLTVGGTYSLKFSLAGGAVAYLSEPGRGLAMYDPSYLPNPQAWREETFSFVASAVSQEFIFSSGVQNNKSVGLDNVRLVGPASTNLSDILVSEADVNEWRNGVWDRSLWDRSSTKITVNSYDARDNLVSTTSYGAATGSGEPAYSDSVTQSTYVYDQAGQLLARIVAGRTNETLAYDGLGRVTSSTDLNGGTTSIVFNDAASTTVVTLANGFTKTSTYNRSGELINCLETGHFTGSTGESYNYDRRGLLRMATDATGLRNYFVYDRLGRKVADVNHLGDLIEYVYDSLGRLTATARYSNRLTASQLAGLANSQVDVELAALRPATTATDLWTWRIYDKEGRLVEAIEGDGSVTRYDYDLAGRLVSTTSYFEKLSTAQLNGFKTTPPTLLQLPNASAKDSSARNFYDKDGFLIGMLDGEGFFSRIVNDRAGQKVEEISYLVANGAANKWEGTFEQLLAGQATSAGDRRLHYVYNGQGQLRFTVDGLNQLAEFVYDAAGQLTGNVAYAGSINATTDYTYDYIKTWTIGSDLETDPATRRTWTVYDGGGRANYTINAEGGVVRFFYDNLGQVTKSVQYAAVRATGALPTLAEMDNWAAGQASNAANRTTRYYYTTAGELRFTVDAEGFVSGNEYDSAGRTTRTVRWATPIAATDADTLATIAGRLGGSFIDNKMVYDDAGRLVETVDGEGFRQRLDYNANGTLASATAAYGHADASRTAYVYDRAGQVIEEYIAHGTAEQSVIRYAYDGLGNLLSVTDPNGNVTTRTYDKLGQMLSETDAIGGIVRFEYNSFGETVKATDARGNSSYNYYDKLGRLIAVRDAEDFVTEMTYSSFGELSSSVRHMNRATSLASVGAAPIVAANAKDSITRFYYDRLGQLTVTRDAEDYLTETAFNTFGETVSITRRANRTTSPVGSVPSVAASALDAVTRFDYDRLGRIVRSTDAEGKFDQFALDAFGNRTSVTNKVGGVISYTYDKRGLLVAETLPVTSVNSEGTVLATSVTNKFEYDGRANRTKTIEAFGLSEARTTSFFFDKADRLTETRGDTVKVLSQANYVTESEVTPTQRIKYDAAGNVIETVDALGARSLFYYDRLNRKIAELNAVGLLATFAYDANSNVIAVRNYAGAVTQPASAGGTPPAAPAGDYRETLYAHDKLGRQVSSTVTRVRTGAWNGSAYVTTVGDLVSRFEYDANGNVVKAIDANGGAVYNFYDRLGRSVAMVDQENYLTTWTLDSEGNALSERRAAQKAEWTPTTASPPSVASSGDDRITNFTYDRNGRRLTETRTNVFAFSPDPNNGSLVHQAAGLATISYAYNGLGQVTRKTEATGDSVTYVYDVGGRLVTETRQGFADQNGNQVVPTLTYSYNGLNLLTRTRQGGATASVTDRITRNDYIRGRLASTTDAIGTTYTYAYDAAGNLISETYHRGKADGSSSKEAILYARDIFGRTTMRAVSAWNGSSWSPGNIQSFGYNIFGELAERGLKGSLGEQTPMQEKFAYDNAGRLWRTNSEDGIWRYFVQDANGNQTLMIESEGTDLANRTIDQVLAIATNNGANAAGAAYVDGINVLISAYDKRDMSMTVNLAKRQLSETGTPIDLVTTRGYNAFGEVAWERDARGAVTNFGYNTMGRNIWIGLPTVSITRENGVVEQAAPLQAYFYDLAGRLVGARDANGYGTTRVLLAGTGYGGAEALTIAEFHPDEGVIRNGYDQFGDLRIAINEAGRTSRMSYDAKGRLTELTQPSNLIEYFAYDLLGQRIRHWNSQLGAANAETTDYDLQGRVVRQVAFGGDVTTMSYTWSSTLTTAGMGTFGGWEQTTTYANARTAIERSDMFGRNLYKKDLGGHEFTLTYDLAGRLTQSLGADTIGYSYLNSGLVASVATMRGSLDGVYERRRASYAYDANGNKTAERVDVDGARWVGGRTSSVGGNDGNDGDGEELGVESSFVGGIRPEPEPEPDPEPKPGPGPGPGRPPVGQLTPYSMVLQDSATTYDALGRMTSWTERGNGTTPAANITYEYDANGNVRRTRATYLGLNAQGGVASSAVKDLWYRYDSMNRVVVSKGTLLSGQIVRGADGISIAYDRSGQRISATRSVQRTANVFDPVTRRTYPVPYLAEVREDYQYDAGGYLSAVRSVEGGYVQNGDGTVTATAPSGPGTLKASHYHDAMGRLTRQIDWLGDGVNAAFDRTLSYNEKGQVWRDVTSSQQRQSNGSMRTFRSETENKFYAFNRFNPNAPVDPATYALGAVVYTATATFNDGGATVSNWTETTNNYLWWDGAVLDRSVFTPNVWAKDLGLSTARDFTSQYSYDNLGQLTSVYINDGRPRTVTFTNDVGGRAIRRDEADQGAGGDPHEVWYRFDGRQMGYVGNNGTLDIDYQASIDARIRTPGTGAFRLGDGNPTDYADFDQNYSPINSYSQGSAGGTYTVRAGETLSSIAAGLWGDSSLWYKIAEVNGMSAESGLVEGQTLTIPVGVLKSQNNATTFKPFDVGSVLGDLNPTTPLPPAQAVAKKNKCGVFGQILLIVVATVVSLVLPMAAPAVFGGFWGGIAAAAVGSVASQALGVATGIQEKFDWKGVAMAALSAGVGGGLGKVSVLKAGANKFANFAKDVVRSALGNAVTQGIGVATGLQSKFSWASVAAAGVGAGASHLAAGKLGLKSFEDIKDDKGKVVVAGDRTLGNHVDFALVGSAGAIAGAATRSLIDGTDFGDNVLSGLAGVVGSTIGNLIKYGISSPGANEGQPIKIAQNGGGLPSKPEEVTVRGLSFTVEAGGVPVHRYNVAGGKFREAWERMARYHGLDPDSKTDYYLIAQYIQKEAFGTEIDWDWVQRYEEYRKVYEGSKDSGPTVPIEAIMALGIPPALPKPKPITYAPIGRTTASTIADYKKIEGFGNGPFGQTFGSLWTGFIDGERSEDDSVVANVGAGLNSFTPYGDGQSIYYAIDDIRQGDRRLGTFIGAGLAVVGAWPGAGDGIKFVGNKLILRPLRKRIDDIGEVLFKLKNKAPDTPASLARSRLPKNVGRWEGTPGDGLWHSNKPDVISITEGRPIRFTNGRPDFSEWSQGSIHFPEGMLDGTENDFKLIHQYIADVKGLPNRSAGEAALKNAGLTAHHFSGTEIQLIPSKLHNNVPHIGSASDLREGRRR